MKEKEIHTTIFRLSPGTHKELKIAAINAGMSMAEAIRQAIELWLKEQKKLKGHSK